MDAGVAPLARRCRRLLGFAPLVGALLGLIPPARSAEAQGAARGPEGLDAEMLRDLEVLRSADYAREREMGRRLGLLERLRMLETLRYLESQPPPGVPAAETPQQKEVR